MSKEQFFKIREYEIERQMEQPRLEDIYERKIRETNNSHYRYFHDNDVR